MKNSLLIGETDHGNRAWVGWNAAALAAIALLALSLSGCGLKFSPLPGPGPEPKPTPTPEPTPPPIPVEECLPGLPWCHELVPPATCGECKHNPTSDPAHCEKAPKCEEPTPQPMPPPTPPPLPPPPSPATAPLIPDEELSAQQPQDGQRLTWSLVSAAVDQWRAENPGRWRADGACLIDGAAGIDAAFQGISDVLLAAGVVAGQSISAGGQRSDCIFTNRIGTNVYEEAHLFDYARACVATSSSAIKGTWIRGASASPPVSACPEPKPPISLFTRISIKRHTQGYCDTTEVLERACEYCASIGLGRMGDGSLRCSCPVRPDCEYGDPGCDRRACEDTLGPAIWETTAGVVEVKDDNPAQARSSAGGQVRKCRKVPDGRTVCSEWCS